MAPNATTIHLSHAPLEGPRPPFRNGCIYAQDTPPQFPCIKDVTLEKSACTWTPFFLETCPSINSIRLVGRPADMFAKLPRSQLGDFSGPLRLLEVTIVDQSPNDETIDPFRGINWWDRWFCFYATACPNLETIQIHASGGNVRVNLRDSGPVDPAASRLAALSLAGPFGWNLFTPFIQYPSIDNCISRRH